eukprot:CAMPEP_0206161304 /NCGR_PEP_ID=MMETSP1474-20131121/7536_1 /ASSEMBLY_ACC=CAM_ASM_001110 /TAXON_ID=97495 /ORGANISM="Imantonia sp., Strain RCC918" /LENGTH=214 /DNA_ID=CAMNT_0053563105 /DNA_START=86 /DNA_END=726 /DNA_ORIENTATION=-
MSTALDCLQKLMAYGYITTDIPDVENPQSNLMEKVIEIIGASFDIQDDDVQIQIIKAFLTAVSSPVCQIHKRPLMNAIRACFNIYLISRNPVNQMTAKATLSQMLNILFSRFETAATKAEETGNLPEPNSEILPEPDNTSDTEEELQLPEDSNLDEETKEELSIAYVDCFLAFRALCKLSMKEITPGASLDSIDMRRKLLALELIQNVLDNAGP